MPCLAILSACGAPDSSAPQNGQASGAESIAAADARQLIGDELLDEEMERLEALGYTGGEVVWDFIAPHVIPKNIQARLFDLQRIPPRESRELA